MTGPGLGSLTADGLRGLRASPTGDVPPAVRLGLYEALGAPVAAAIRAGRERFDAPAAGRGRYVRLALAAARLVLPVWDDYFEAVRPAGPDAQRLRRFPHGMAEAAEQMAAGARPPSMLAAADPHTALGALPYVVDYACAQVAEAAYGALMAANGYVPFTSLPPGVDLGTATDLDLDRHSGNWDAAWHAAEAVSAVDHDAPGAGQRTPVSYDYGKRFEFWQWWLSEVIAVARR